MAGKPLSTAFGARTSECCRGDATHLSGLCMRGQRHRAGKTPSSLASSEPNALRRHERKGAARCPGGHTWSSGGQPCLLDPRGEASQRHGAPPRRPATPPSH